MTTQELVDVVHAPLGVPVTTYPSRLLRSDNAGESQFTSTWESPADASIFVGGGYWIVSSSTTSPLDHDSPNEVPDSPTL